jgi:hypothetical protein
VLIIHVDHAQQQLYAQQYAHHVAQYAIVIHVYVAQDAFASLANAAAHVYVIHAVAQL